MTRRRIELQPAYLLHTRSYGDTSLLIEAFTPEHGRIGLVARGARGARSKTRAHLQPLQPLLLSWSLSGDLGTLTGVEARGQPTRLVGEPLFCAWYANELLMRLTTRHDPHPLLFGAYVELLPQLAIDAEPALRRFECRLLAELGYGLLLPEDLDPQWRYRYDWDEGPRPLDAADDPAAGFSGVSLIALRDGRLDDEPVRREARQLLRAALRRHLGERPLESARLLRELRSLEERPA